MAWHPDRFTSDSQKQKAEEELKHINAARDCLRLHFADEHKMQGPCACQFEQSQAPAGPARAAAPEADRSAASSAAPPPAGKRFYPARALSSPIAAAAGLSILSFATISAYLKVTSWQSAPSQFQSYSRLPAPQPGLGQSTPSPDVQPAASPTAPAPADLSTPAQAPPVRESPGEIRATRAVPGTFYAGFVEREEQRKQQALRAQRLVLENTLAAAEREAQRTAGDLERCEKRMAAIDQGVAEHQEVMSEILRAGGDLEKSPLPGAVPATVSVYFSNPDYKRHFDACTELSRERQTLEAIATRIREKLVGQRQLVEAIRSKLSAPGR